MVGDSRRYMFEGNLEAPVDHEIIVDYQEAIRERKKELEELEKKEAKSGLSQAMPSDITQD
jgi:hypothetical protein